MARLSLLALGLGIWLAGTMLGCGSGTMSGPVGECDPLPTEPPPTPRLLSAMRITPTMVLLRWEAGPGSITQGKVAEAEAGARALTCVLPQTVYRLYRALSPTAPMFEPVCPPSFGCAIEMPATDPGPFELLDTVPSSTDTYYYTVTAANEAGVSAVSAIVPVEPLAP